MLDICMASRLGDALETWLVAISRRFESIGSGMIECCYEKAMVGTGVGAQSCG
jgi:hypothetical protein